MESNADWLSAGGMTVLPILPRLLLKRVVLSRIGYNSTHELEFVKWILRIDIHDLVSSSRDLLLVILSRTPHTNPFGVDRLYHTYFYGYFQSIHLNGSTIFRTSEKY